VIMGWGQSRLEAEAYLGHNIECAWVGEHTPLIVEVIPTAR